MSQSKAFWFPILNQLPWNVSMVCALSHVHTKVRLSYFSIFEIAIEVMPSPIISSTFDNKDIPSFFINIWNFLTTHCLLAITSHFQIFIQGGCNSKDLKLNLYCLRSINTEVSLVPMSSQTQPFKICHNPHVWLTY